MSHCSCRPPLFQLASVIPGPVCPSLLWPVLLSGHVDVFLYIFPTFFVPANMFFFCFEVTVCTAQVHLDDGPAYISGCS